jgi:hypothetical protein
MRTSAHPRTALGAHLEERPHDARDGLGLLSRRTKDDSRWKGTPRVHASPDCNLRHLLCTHMGTSSREDTEPTEMGSPHGGLPDKDCGHHGNCQSEPLQHAFSGRRAIIAGIISGWAQSVSFALLSCDEARQSEVMVDSWMILAQYAALSAHTLILEDGPELPKVPGPHAKKGGETLANMYTEECSSLQDSRRHQERAGSLGTASGTSPDPAAIISKDPRVAPT